MTDVEQVLLALIRYAGDRNKPAVLRVHPETILLLRSRGLIELQEDGYWITGLGKQVASQGGPIEEARVAFKDQGIRIFTIGVGDAARTVGVEVPTSEGERKQLLHDGQIVFSRLDVDGLRNIAEAGGGDYAPLVQLYQVVNRIAGMRRAELSAEERMRHRPRYQWFVALALLILFV